jgi:hypothetical protein
MFYEERRDLIAENITTASGPFAVGPEFPYCFIASPKIQAQMTIFAAAIDDSICTLIDLMERIYISNFLHAQCYACYTKKTPPQTPSDSSNARNDGCSAGRQS